MKPKDPSVIYQVKRAFKSGNRLATFVGMLLGSFVPIGVYFTCHRAGFAWNVGAPSGLVLGGLCYSAQTVFQWARMAFTGAVKSLGFTLLLEGILVTSQTHWLAIVALAYLCAINSIATGCTLSLGARK